MLGLDAYDPQPIGSGTNSGSMLYMAFIEAYSPAVMFRPLSPSETYMGWPHISNRSVYASQSGFFAKFYFVTFKKYDLGDPSSARDEISAVLVQ